MRERIGKYELIKPLGQGATSVVYESYHPELRRVVAIKLLNHDRILDEQSLARFRAEGEKLAALRHPHIVTIYDANYEKGRPYIVTELLEGHDLDTHLSKSKRFSMAEILDIASQLADALAATHAEGIVHRDVKLSNIMATYKQGKLHITLMDYGIARTDNAFTEDGHFIGTHAYASPEQLCCERVDHRSDIYSMGVVLYVLMSNMLPSNSLFQIKNSLPVKLADVVQVPKYIARIVDKCLEKNPKHRFQSASELQNAIHKAQQRYHSTRFKYWRSWREKASRPLKHALIASAVVAVLLAGFYPWLLYQYRWHELANYSRSHAQQAAIIASQLEETLALNPDRLKVTLAAPVYKHRYDQLLVLDNNGIVKASVADKQLLDSRYQAQGNLIETLSNQRYTLRANSPFDLPGKLGTFVNQLRLPALSDVTEFSYHMRFLDKPLGRLIIKNRQNLFDYFNTVYLIVSAVLLGLVFALVYRSTSQLDKLLRYTRKNMQTSFQYYSQKFSRQLVASTPGDWSNENQAIPFDWEKFAAPDAVPEQTPVKNAADVLQHTAREQLLLAAHFDNIARNKDKV